METTITIIIFVGIDAIPEQWARTYFPYFKFRRSIMLINIENCNLINQGDFYLHDSGFEEIKYNPELQCLEMKMDTLLDEETNCSEAILIIKNVQYLEFDNCFIDVINCSNWMVDWECLPLESISGFKQTNIVCKGKPFCVSFLFANQARINVVTTEIDFQRV
jgi:hypothetical protein